MSKQNAWEDVKHKRAVQGAISITGASLGLAALGAKGGAVVLRKYPKALKSITVKPKKLESASLGLMTTGAGVGGFGGYHYAALQRAENKSQNQTEKVIKMLEHSPFGVVNKANYDEAAQYAGYGGAAAGVGGAFAAKDIAPHYVKLRMKRIKAEEKTQVKAKNKAEAKSIQHEKQASAYRSGRVNSVNRGVPSGLDANIAGAKKHGQKAVAQTKAYYKASDNIKRLADKKVMVKTTAVPKVRAAALAVGAASLAGSEIARQHKVQKDGWWGA